MTLSNIQVSFIEEFQGEVSTTVGEFLEFLENEGILDEEEMVAYDNLKYQRTITRGQLEYVIETIETWTEEEYYNRLEIIHG